MRLSREQSRSLADLVERYHPDLGGAEAPDLDEMEVELGFAVRGAECVEWGMGLQRGYAAMNRRGKGKRVHRALLEIVAGVSDLQAIHKCGNKPCVNLDHVKYGTAAENREDQFRLKETSAVGEGHVWSRLTAEQVADIRARYNPGKNRKQGNGPLLEAEYGLSAGYASQIAKGRTWRR